MAGLLVAAIALLATRSESAAAYFIENTLIVSLKPTSVRRQLKPYQVLDSPANQYVHVALNGSVTLWYRRNSSVGGNVRLMSWAIMPFHRAIPKNDARYSQIWDRDESTTTLRLTKIDEIILKQSFRAVANVYPVRLTTTSGTVHILKEKDYILTVAQERHLTGKIQLKATVVQGSPPIFLTLRNSTSNKSINLLKVASNPDVHVALIDSSKHNNVSQFIIVAENAVRMDAIKVNVFLRNFGSLLGCQVFDLIDTNSTLVYVECGYYSYPISTGELACTGVNSNVFRLRKTTSEQNHWLHSMFPVYLQFVAESANIRMCGDLFLDCLLKVKNGWESKIYLVKLNFRVSCKDEDKPPTSSTSATPSSPAISSVALCPVQDKSNRTMLAVSDVTFDNDSADVAFIASDAGNITVTIAFKDGRTVSFQKQIQVITPDESPTAFYQTYQIALIVVSLAFLGLTCAVSLYLSRVRCIAKKKDCSTHQPPQSGESHTAVESEVMHVNPLYLSSQGASVA
ncbi:uncharacterized protein [Oscarella lobularis]|uniref:uncharacterized protein n=1 Tax=Oscarella lobularis TaxID=121494 RepID=UPI0033130B9B